MKYSIHQYLKYKTYSSDRFKKKNQIYNAAKEIHVFNDNDAKGFIPFTYNACS